MAWLVVGTTAALGALTASQNRQAQQRANQQSADLSAAQMQYSPWTGVKPQAAQVTPVTANALGGALQGGLAGAMHEASNKPVDTGYVAAGANPQTVMPNFSGQLAQDSLPPWMQKK